MLYIASDIVDILFCDHYGCRHPFHKRISTSVSYFLFFFCITDVEIRFRKM